MSIRTEKGHVNFKGPHPQHATVENQSNRVFGQTISHIPIGQGFKERNHVTREEVN